MANLEIKYHRIKVLPPIGKKKKYPELSLTVIYAKEPMEPEDREQIDWKLITDLPVNTLEEAIEKLQWYSMRWKIEIYQSYCLHKNKTHINEPFELLSYKSIVSGGSVYLEAA